MKNVEINAQRKTNNYFEFSEITYEDGSKEGSRSFDKEFAKSFNMSVLSYDAIDDLK